MAPRPSILIAGAGIGGLTAALALARRDFPVVVLEAVPQLEATGAGIQLSPNATQILLSLGLGPALKPHVTAPEALRVMSARAGREIVAMPLGLSAALRYGAPFWSIHRADLQRVLLQALQAHPGIVLRLGAAVTGYRTDAGGVTAAGKAGAIMLQEHGAALIGADGLHSAVRRELDPGATPRFRRRSAWRAAVPAQALAAEWREPATTLWLGPDAHLVHYPVAAGRIVNIVAIVRDSSERGGRNEPGAADDLSARFARWAPAARAIVAAAAQWQTWSLYDLPPLAAWGSGPATLLGDAAHGMLPFLAQGGAMAIEDAWAVAHELARSPDDPAAAFRAYEALRGARTERVARAARRTGRIYHLGAPVATVRDLVLRLSGGERLLRRYDWLYEWRLT